MSSSNDHVELRNANLAQISKLSANNSGFKNVVVPMCEVKTNATIVHLAVGGFHRSHQAFYLDQLHEQYHKDPATAPAEIFGICGVGLLPGDEKLYRSLHKQDYLYTLVTMSEKGLFARIVRSIKDYIFTQERSVVEQMACPSTKIVSITATEKGYTQNKEGTLDFNNINIQHDLSNIMHPKTVIGAIVAGLSQRKKAGLPPFTVLSCDNVPHNGETTRKLVLEFATVLDSDLKEWIVNECAFPNTMVDRITPMTTEEHRVMVKDTFGIIDECPVVCEPFLQWVIEDKFVCGRPEWEKLGAILVSDASPYEEMKLRLLNGGHSALSYLAWLCSFLRVDIALTNKTICKFVEGFMDEVTPSVPKVPGVDLEPYKRELIERFMNPCLKDTIERLTQDGSKKMLYQVKGSIMDLKNMNLPTKHIACMAACFIKFMSGVDCNGVAIKIIDDPLAEKLRVPCLEACAAPYNASEALQIIFGIEVLNVGFDLDVQNALKRLIEGGPMQLAESLF